MLNRNGLSNNKPKHLFFKNKNIRASYRLGTLLLAMLIPTGCALKEIQKQAKSIEDLGSIKGTIKNESSQNGPVIVERYRASGGVFINEDKTPMNARGEYVFFVKPGSYYIAAFVDTNADGKFQNTEPFSYFGGPTETPVKSKQTIIVETITITDTPPEGSEKINSVVQFDLLVRNIGRIVSMDDPMMNSEHYSTGLWQPYDFITQVGGGLLLLQDFDPNKIPIVFVHGINGGPKNWEKIVAKMDRKKFQPWLLYYPSGVRLGIVSQYMVEAITELKSKFKFDQFNIVAHSMGGLVTRSFIKKYVEQFPDEAKNIKLVMTINSPMGGMASAASGVKHSPIVISSWRDVAASSDFLQDIHSWSWPSYIDYHLVFSYKNSESGDGVVSLQSQIPAKLQAEAVRMYGFNNNHAGILDDEQFLTEFNAILAKGVK